MFKFLKKFFVFNKKAPVVKREEKPESTALAPKKINLSIPFDTHLIHGLETEHQLLLKYYTETMKYAERKDYTKLQSSLNKFSKLLGTHLSKEDIKLYMFLDYVVEDVDAKNHQYISRDFRLEMRDITLAVTSVINKHTNILVNSKTIQTFVKEFGELGGVLVDRIKREEKTLYPIYSRYEA